MEAVDDFVLLFSNASFCFSPYAKFFQSVFLWFSAGIRHLLPPPTTFGDELFEYRAALAHAWDASLCSLKSAVSIGRSLRLSYCGASRQHSLCCPYRMLSLADLLKIWKENN